MAKGGRRYPLLVYREMLNRWWPDVFWLGLGMFGLAWLAYWSTSGQLEVWRWKGLVALGGLSLIVSLILFVMRGIAYIQPFPTYVRLVTPLLRINISYKRLRKYTTTEMRAVFPPTKKMSGWKREVVGKFSSKTALVLELAGWPVQPELMRLFLSPLFFRDKTPHFVILVNDWMRLSLEIDSMRTGGGVQQEKRPQNQSILSRLPRGDK